MHAFAMEIVLNEILFTTVAAIAVLVVSGGVLLAALHLHIKILLRRRAKIQERFSLEEMKLLELSTDINRFTISINSYILELIRKKQELQDRKCKCEQIYE